MAIIMPNPRKYIKDLQKKITSQEKMTVGEGRRYILEAAMTKETMILAKEGHNVNTMPRQKLLGLLGERMKVQQEQNPGMPVYDWFLEQFYPDQAAKTAAGEEGEK